MKSLRHRSVSSCGNRSRRGYTLVELMVAMAIFTFVIGGVVYAHVAGIKMYEAVKIRLGASDQLVA